MNILLLEDDPVDAELVVQALQAGGLEFTWQRVETEPDYLAALVGRPDLILADYQLPRFDAPRALAALQSRDLHIPFIVVTGAVGEEEAVACMREGAADYLFKDRLGRLGAAVRHALEARRLRDVERQADTHARFQAALLDAAGQAMIAVNPHGAITYWNRAAEDLYGWAAAEVVGRSIQDVTPADPSSEQAGEIMNARNRGESWSGEFMTRRRDGGSFPAMVTYTPLHDAEGMLVGMIGVSIDISERKRAEQTLRESEYRSRGVIDASSDSIVLVDREGTILFANQAAANIRGFASPNELVETNGFVFVAPEDLARIRNELGRAAAGEVVTYQYTAVRGDAERIVMESTLGRVLDIRGELVGITSVARDITARTHAEETLRRSEEQYRRMVEVSYEGICLIDKDMRLAFVNDRIAEMLGYTKEELLGASIFAFTDQPGRADMERRIDLTNQGIRGAREGRYRRKDGSTLWAIASSASFLDDAGHVTGALSMFTDITARKQIEEQAARHVARLSTLRLIDMAIMASVDLSLTLHVILEQIVGRLAVDAAAVLVRSPHAQVLDYAALLGFHDHARPRPQYRIGEGPAGQAALERRRVIVPDATHELVIHPAMAAEEGFVTYLAQPLIAKGQVQGVLELFHRTPFSPDLDWLDFMEAVAGQAAIAVDNARLFEGVQRTTLELTVAYNATIEGWSRALDLRDNETEGHSRRVTELTMTLAHTMGMSDEMLVHVRRGALLHDIGKMGIPDHILLKPGPLTDEEWVIMRKHPFLAYELLLPITYLRPALDIPYRHHEKWDGTGYPHGLMGEQIPEAARIFAVVDVWDALRSDRPYRKAWPVEKVRDHIRALTGSHFEPAVVEAFLSLEVRY